MKFRTLPKPWTGMSCPDCGTTLDRVEFLVQPTVLAGRCNGCHGLFFETGDLEQALAGQDSIWIDDPKLEPIPQIHADLMEEPRRRYRKCPACSERMTPLNFAHRSGVLLDVCGQHGSWLDAGELRQLANWWRGGGGKAFTQQREEAWRRRLREPVEVRYGSTPKRRVPMVIPGTQSRWARFLKALADALMMKAPPL